ncbi:MAG: hypothetical protein COB36_07180 [Alphaproteobacteria bacterium]|nr:MAG: hypothetical protein COB36_07180 [Alphaproteobacteria bacterium]
MMSVHKKSRNTSRVIFRRVLPIALLVFSLFAFMFESTVLAPDAESYIFTDVCAKCSKVDCAFATDFIDDAHDDIVDRVKDEFNADLGEFEDWLIEVMFKTQFLPAAADMATQMSAVAMQYTQAIGMFLDAQNQMDTQRLLRELQFEAHKDYQPSQDFCWFGTNVRSLAATENIGRFNSLVFSQISLARQLGNVNIAGSLNASDDYKARWEQFVDTYCDPRDNNRQIGGTGLELACDRNGKVSGSAAGAVDLQRVNRDIDYTRLIEEPRTLNIDMADTTLNVTAEPLDTLIVGLIREPGDEEDVIALSKNLYGHNVLSRALSRVLMKTSSAQKLYLALRSVAAKRGVAQASFNAIVGLKSSGTQHEHLLEPFAHPGAAFGIPATVAAGVLGTKHSGRFMASIVQELLPASLSGVGGNIFDLIGYSPSYYSQLEFLTKRIYQNPDFYANLYDTPANVSRKKVAMRAIELMIDRAIYESQLRREMNVSVLLSSKLRESHRAVNEGLATSKGK